MSTDPRMAAVRNAASSDAAFAAAFSRSAPAPEPEASQAAAPEAPATGQPGGEVTYSARTAQLLALSPAELADALEAQALETLRAERRAMEAERELERLHSTPDAQLAALRELRQGAQR